MSELGRFGVCLIWIREISRLGNCPRTISSRDISVPGHADPRTFRSSDLLVLGYFGPGYVRTGTFWYLDTLPPTGSALVHTVQSPLTNGIWEIQAGCFCFLHLQLLAQIGLIPLFKASKASDQNEVLLNSREYTRKLFSCDFAFFWLRRAYAGSAP